MFWIIGTLKVFNVKNEKRFLEIWNNVNLFSETRGINRFKGLYLSFEIMSKEDDSVKPLNEVKKWALDAKELSNKALEKYIEENDIDELKDTLKWSYEVNSKIESLKGMDKPYEGVKEAFVEMKKYCDIAIVSSANKEAINSEWGGHNLLQYCDYVMGQEDGSKATCIKSLIEKGYSIDKILMVGDSPGDYDSAKANEVSFYPIMFGDEKTSWENFKNKELQNFLNGVYEEKRICK